MIEAIWSLLHISILCCDHLDHKAPVKLRSEELKFSREKRNPSGRRTSRRGVRPLIIRQHRQDEQHDAVGDKKWYRLMPKITQQKWLFERLKTALYKVNRWKRTTHNLWLATSRKWDCSPGICHKHSAASSICNNLWCDSLGNWTDIQPLKWVGSPLGGRRGWWWGGARPVAFGKQSRIMQHMKSKLVASLSITHLSVSLLSCLPFFSLPFFHPLQQTSMKSCAPALTDGHSTWGIDFFLSSFQRGRKGAPLKSWILRVSITRRDKTKTL